MAILQPNYFQTGSYSAKKDRRVNSAQVMQEGIVRRGHYALAQRAAGANMSVDVAAGEAWVKGDSAVDQGYYHVVNDATVNVPLTAASASNPRVDAIVLAVNDSTEVGGADSYLLEAIAGTPTAGATLANLKGAPTPGATKLLLGYVLVATSATKVETSAMGGLRDPNNFNGLLGMTKAESYAIAGAPPQYAHGRPLDWVPSVRALLLTPTAYTNLNVTPMAMTTESWDTEEIHNTAAETAKIIVRTPGIWRFDAQVHFNAPTNGVVLFKVNGVEETYYKFAAQGTNTSGDFSNYMVARFGYGDVIEPCALANGSQTTYFGGCTAIWQGP